MAFNVSFKGNVISTLEKRAAAWASAGNMNVRLTADGVPWWYWNEFGTASRADYSGQEAGTWPTKVVQDTAGRRAPYTIAPNGQPELIFRGNNGVLRHFQGSVPHPGIKPRRNVQGALPEIQEAIRREVRLALLQNFALDNPKTLLNALTAAMSSTKSLIVAKIAENLQGFDYETTLDKEYGRLGGAVASQVFAQAAQVVVGQGTE